MEPHTDRDVAIIIDASLEGIYRNAAERVVTRLAARVARIALLVYADHAHCLRGPSDLAPPPFEFREREFSQEKPAAWLQANFISVPNPYYDAAIECALKWAAGLDWRDNISKYLYVIGNSLPHEPREQASTTGIRTGVKCPNGVAWRAQVELLRALGVRRFAAVPPQADDQTVGRLMRGFWSEVGDSGQLDALDAELCGRWANHHAT